MRIIRCSCRSAVAGGLWRSADSPLAEKELVLRVATWRIITPVPVPESARRPPASERGRGVETGCSSGHMPSALERGPVST